MSILQFQYIVNFLRRSFYDVNNKERYHFFAYIKFFVYEGQKYGLVGGKTNYPYPDISFDYKIPTIF